MNESLNNNESVKSFLIDLAINGKLKENSLVEIDYTNELTFKGSTKKEKSCLDNRIATIRCKEQQ